MSEKLFSGNNFHRWVGNYKGIESATRHQSSGGVDGKIKRASIQYASYEVAKRATFSVDNRLWSPEIESPKKALTAGGIFTAHITHNSVGTAKFTIQGIERKELVSKSAIIREAKRTMRELKVPRADRKEIITTLKDYLTFRGEFNPS